MMIKSYNKPEMKITLFQNENVATTGSIETVDAPKDYVVVESNKATSYGTVESSLFSFNN